MSMIQPSTKKTRYVRGFKFTGMRAAFLKKRLPDYLAAVSDHRLSRFWQRLFPDYWHTFPWRLPIDVDPHCSMPLDALTDEAKPSEWEWKYQLVERTQMKIRTYYLRQRLRRAGASNPSAAAAVAAAAETAAEAADASTAEAATDAADIITVANALLPAGSEL
ncbi:hypothetical protein B0H15DRAFT_807049 [Mycena belliarum]|uniref:Uncharacterized protein n=1 Tax=Mycena belliarum TaxID=1033014 RepID=A0AAD6XIA9_9AGAR|nr:hypothetical protein B0H15DRAFT_807049 [Mycena belliae]